MMATEKLYKSFKKLLTKSSSSSKIYKVPLKRNGVRKNTQNIENFIVQRFSRNHKSESKSKLKSTTITKIGKTFKQLNSPRTILKNNNFAIQIL